MPNDLSAEEFEVIHRAKEAGLNVAAILRPLVAECEPLPDEDELMRLMDWDD